MTLSCMDVLQFQRPAVRLTRPNGWCADILSGFQRHGLFRSRFISSKLAMKKSSTCNILPDISDKHARGARPRFLCDEMLGRLCRYLRAAGYDALSANGGRSDGDLLRQCREEGRYFLTQDQLVQEQRAARGVALLLPQGNLDRLAAALGSHFKLDWLGHAFTRCLEDTTPLVVADVAASARAPADALRPDEVLYHCPACGRVYWHGSHYKRMRGRLEAWQAAKTGPSVPPGTVA
jgi:uncharacterized protein with PIN domain